MRGPAGPKRAGGVLICYPTVVTVASQKDEGYSSNKPALMASSWVVAGGHMPYRRNCARVLLVGVCRVPSVSSGQQRPASWAVSDKVTFSESCPAAFRRRLRWCCGVPPPPQHTPHRRDLTGNQHHGAVVRRIWAGKRLRGRGWRRWTSRHPWLHMHVQSRVCGLRTLYDGHPCRSFVPVPVCGGWPGGQVGEEMAPFRSGHWKAAMMARFVCLFTVT